MPAANSVRRGGEAQCALRTDFLASDEETDLDEAEKARGLSVPCRAASSESRERSPTHEPQGVRIDHGSGTRVVKRGGSPWQGRGDSPLLKARRRTSSNCVRRESPRPLSRSLHSGSAHGQLPSSRGRSRSRRRNQTRGNCDEPGSSVGSIVDMAKPRLPNPPPFPTYTTVPCGPPVMPMLHVVMLGVVQAKTPKGAVIRLSDGGPTRYFDGLLKKQTDELELRIGKQVFVKVVRLEPGLVVVDTRTVDQGTGEDSDPFNECAEIEDWIDVPAALVGRVIGKGGARIRALCEESGADLRFDESFNFAGQDRPQHQSTSVGADLRRFMEAAQADNHADSQVAPHDACGDDLRKFLLEAQEGEPDALPSCGNVGAEAGPALGANGEGIADEGADDLRRFLEEARGDVAEKGSGMSVIGSVAVECRRGQGEVVQDSGSISVSLAKDGAKVDNDHVQERPEALHIGGAQNLTRKHILEVLQVGGLPEPLSVEHPEKDQMVLVFEDDTESRLVLRELKAGFDKVKVGEREGPGLYRARHGMLSYRVATSADVKPVPTIDEVKAVEVKKNITSNVPRQIRLRINGDAKEVARAKAGVFALLEELLGRSPLDSVDGGSAYGVGDRYIPGLRLLPGQIRKYVQIPSKLVGRAIGKGGETVRKLEADSGARLRVLEEVNDEFYQMAIQGGAEAVADAQAMLESMLGTQLRLPRKGAEVPSPCRRELDLSPSRHRSDRNHDEESQPVTAKLEQRSAMLSPARREAVASPAKEERRDVRARKREMEQREVDLYLQRQMKLDQAAAEAEAEAEELAKLATKHPEASAAEVAALLGVKAAEEGWDSTGGYLDWVDETEACPNVDMLALTPYGAGRVYRAVVTRRGSRYLSVRLLAGGSVQALESVVVEWLDAVRQWLGLCVFRPTPGMEGPETVLRAPKPVRSSSWVQDWDLMKARLLASGAGLVVSQAVEDGPRVAFRLAQFDGGARALNATGASRSSLQRIVDLHDLASWPRIEATVYMVDLCATPQAVGQVALYRHDYRTRPSPFSKGDLVVLEGSRNYVRDVGVVRKVLTGEKAERAAALAKSASALTSPSLRVLRLPRALRTCTVEERARRVGAMSCLEATALPLLTARLPKGVEALGVGASLDGILLRFFVKFSGAALVHNTASAAMAASAALGALLGCETELLAIGEASKAKQELSQTEVARGISSVKAT